MFAYNRSIHSSTHYYPFKVVYDFISLSPLDLSPLPLHVRVNLESKKKADIIRALHQKVCIHIEQKECICCISTNKGV